MKVTLNGHEVNATEGISVLELLISQKVDMPEYVTVQLNEEFISVDEVKTTSLKDGDSVEFLYFMGGGK